MKLTEAELRVLERTLRASFTSKREHLRAQIVLLRAAGTKESAVAQQLGVSMACVSKWSKRVGELGLDGLRNRPGRGPKAWLPVDKVQAVINRLAQPGS